MYTIELAETRVGRSTVTVKQRGRLVCCASVDFIRWMHDHVPTKQLREEQKALVRWYEKTANGGELWGMPEETTPQTHGMRASHEARPSL